MRTLLPRKWNQFEQTIADATRREFLTSSASGLGGLALSAHLASELVAEEGARRHDPLGPRAAHSSAKAKACIFLFLEGGPSHIDMWDLKPNAPSEVRGPFNPISTKVPGGRSASHESRRMLFVPPRSMNSDSMNASATYPRPNR